MPRPDPAKEKGRPRIRPIGEIGSAASLPSGCRFHPRCPRARLVAARGGDTVEAGGARLPTACVTRDPALAPVDAAAHLAACHFPDES